MTDYAAFISYSTRYSEWVEVLQRNLETCLEALGESPSLVFLDKKDIAPGRSWITQLEAGLMGSAKLILVLTPESMVSGRVENEWQVIVDQHPDWSRTGKILPLRLLWTPLPPFLRTIQWIDCVDGSGYDEQMAKLVGALLDRPPRSLPALPPLESPKHPESALPGGFLKDMVGRMAPTLQSRTARKCLVASLGLTPLDLLESYPTGELKASALWVHAKGSDDALDAAKHLVSTAIKEWKDDAPDAVTALRELSARLEEPKPPAGSRSFTPYLDLIRQDHGRLLPLFEPGAESELLEKVYVSLSLQPTLDETRFGRAMLEFRSGSLRELLELEPSEHPRVTRRWVVRGDPGSGKTTLLRHLASTLAGADDPRWIPMFLSLPRLVRKGCSVLDMIASRLRRGGIGLERKRFHELGQAGRLLVLLDGLDEVPGEKREDVEDLLLDLMRDWPETPIVVSTRKIGYVQPHSSFREVDVQPLDRRQQLEFLARRLRDDGGEPDAERAGRELNAIERHTHLSDLAKNPLNLTLMSLLIEQGTAISGNRAKLYDDIFELLLSGRHRRRRRMEDIEAIERPKTVRHALCHLAYEMSQQNRDTAPKDDLEEWLRSDSKIVRKLRMTDRWDRKLRAFFDDVGELTGILGPHDGADEDWRYWHRTFREALTAEKLEALHHEDAAKIVKQARVISSAKREEMDKSRWAEAYAMLAGRLEAPDELVLSLIEEDRDLGLRALEGVQALEGDTLSRLFAHEAWQVRTVAYHRMPDLVGAAEQALNWIDKRRRQTRNGNDLFFLDLAAERTGERWPAAEADAEALRSRLYDHIPQPSEELFRWIETKDGRVELWKTIPAGTSVIGAPEGEDGRREHDRHPQELTIEAPFAMAAVPVTQEQFVTFDPEHKSHHSGQRNPAERFTWYQSVSFCQWLSQSFEWAKGARLPSEEEWEYACRAGTTTRFWSGDTARDLERVGWYGEGPSGNTHSVGEKDANPWGLYDVHGNVWEWTCSEGRSYDGRDTAISVDPRSNPAAASAAPSAVRVFRGGGCWDSARGARSAYRLWDGPVGWNWVLGFRVLLPFPPSDR